MIYTSSYDKCDSDIIKKISISGDKGKSVGYIGDSYSKLAPKKEFWDKWHDNIEKVPKEANDYYYVEEFYKQVLTNLDPDEVISELDNSVLLCYEDNKEFCHRHIVAEWLNIFCNIEVPEIIIENDIIIPVKRPLYIRNLLAHAINKYGHGFTSIEALKYYLKGEILEKRMSNASESEIEELRKQVFDSWYRASEIEAYTEENEIKKLIKK